MTFLKKKIITGCDARGDGDSPYLTRWTILAGKFGAVYLHRFHRSDSPEHHDHPWAFCSIILWRGYFEETAEIYDTGIPISTFNGKPTGKTAKAWRPKRKRVWPGMILFRRATHRHRVVLADEREAWTLVIRGAYVRDWGFFTKRGWQHWRDYFKERGC